MKTNRVNTENKGILASQLADRNMPVSELALMWKEFL